MTLEKGKDKIQKICDKLRSEILEPAKKEAEKLIEEAKKKVMKMEEEGRLQVEQLVKEAHSQMEKERKIFHSSLQQAAKQVVEELRQEIEHAFFNQELETIVNQLLIDPEMIAKCINGMIQAVEKEGLGSNLSAVIPQHISPSEVYALLLDQAKKKLKEPSLEVGRFPSGAQLKLVDRKIMLDLSGQTIKELLANYLRKDFRSFIFG